MRSMRAATSGSPGTSKGRRSTTTSDSASPGTSTPCQNEVVPRSTASAVVRKASTSAARLPSPCRKTVDHHERQCVARHVHPVPERGRPQKHRLGGGPEGLHQRGAAPLSLQEDGRPPRATVRRPARPPRARTRSSPEAPPRRWSGRPPPARRGSPLPAGRRSTTTSDSASPGTSTPCQNEVVPRSTASAVVRKASTSAARLPSPCTKTVDHHERQCVARHVHPVPERGRPQKHRLGGGPEGLHQRGAAPLSLHE